MGNNSSTEPELTIHWLDPAMAAVMSHARPVVLWDKDSTLFDTSHRQPMIERIKPPDGQPKTATWEQYSMAAAGDTVFAGAKALTHLLRSSCIQLILTGANASALTVVEELVLDSDVAVDGLILRPDGCYIGNSEMKVLFIKQLQAMGYNITLMLEDWAEVAVRVTAETGVPVLGVNPFYDSSPHSPETGTFVPELPMEHG